MALADRTMTYAHRSILRRCRPRRLLAGAALLLGASAVGARPAHAQSGTVSLQAARLDGAATTTAVGVGWIVPLGEPALPAPGETSEEEVSDWLITLGLGAGASWAGARGEKNAFTVTGHGGLAWRTGTFVEQVGVEAWGNLEPLAAGPAVRARVAVVDVRAGGLWMENDLGLRWFAGLDLSLQFLLDVFAR